MIPLVHVDVVPQDAEVEREQARFQGAAQFRDEPAQFGGQLLVAHAEEAAVGAVLRRDLGGDEDPGRGGTAPLEQPYGGLVRCQRGAAVSEQCVGTVQVGAQRFAEVVGHRLVGGVGGLAHPVLPAGQLHGADLDAVDR